MFPAPARLAVASAVTYPLCGRNMILARTRRSLPVRLLPWSLGIAAGLVAALALALFILSRDPSPGLLASLPASCGAEGPGFEVACVEGAPYLVENGIPYPTGFDSDDHVRQSLDGPWLLRLDPEDRGLREDWALGGWPEGTADSIRVPSTYNAPSGPRRGHQGAAWFARRFVLEPAMSAAGGWARLAFHGVLLRSQVWLNGSPLGIREGGYTPFYFDVTSHLKPGGENILVVRADNRLTYASLPPRVRPEHNPVWGVYGGIHREVVLEAVPARSVFKLTARPFRDAGSAGFLVEAFLHESGPSPACTLSLLLLDPKGRVAASSRTVLPSSNPAPAVSRRAFRLVLDTVFSWAPRRPDLYTLEARLEGGNRAETVRIRVGHRILSVAGAGLEMDGRRLFLKGISKMEDDPALGQTQTVETLARDLDLAVGLGANYLRLAHYPHDVREVRLARDLGIMVAEEIPWFHVGAGWSQWLVDFQGLDGFPFSSFGMRQMHRRDLLLHAQQSLLEMIERDGHNPAVILWSLGNESYTLGAEAAKVYGWLRETARAFDPTRPATMAEMTYYLPALDRLRASAGQMDLASINAYYGWYFGEAESIASHLDDFHVLHPGKGLLLSEFGAEAALGRSDTDGIRTGDRVFFPRTYSESYQASLLERHVRLAWERPYVVGVSPWVFADFYCPWFPHNPVPEYNTKGILTRERVPKQGYFALQRLYRELPDYRP